MGQNIEAGAANIPGIGRVAYRVEVTGNTRVLQSARHVEENRAVTSEEHMAQIAEHLNIT
ncbi:hypothetical protein [uncultured Microbacterium sp.]|uniref:hypothetical protein n=1 Tax=uncultured Microbacterium sp. TaxID=191216 RepID=UPI0025FBFB2D|nr:hypothetical protein [uncultured Microbacterium sp.]